MKSTSHPRLETPQRISKFRELSGGILIVRDNNTRWNSWADMLDCMLRPEIRRAVRLYVDDNPDLEADRLGTADWDLLEGIQRILSAFRLATKETEGHNATLAKVLPSIDYLLHIYSKSLEEYSGNILLCSMICIGWEKLDKYYSATSRAPVYLAAVVLHPRLKWRYFEARWKPEWVRDAKKSLKNYWIQYKSTITTSNPGSPAKESAPDNNPLNQWLDLGDILESTMPLNYNAILDEYDKYCQDSTPNRTIRDSLSYWLDPALKKEYPTLSKWAIDVQSIPAMSSEPEPVFSGAKRVISDLRHCLSVDAIEATSCLRSWGRVLEEEETRN